MNEDPGEAKKKKRNPLFPGSPIVLYSPRVLGTCVRSVAKKIVYEASCNLGGKEPACTAESRLGRQEGGKNDLRRGVPVLLLCRKPLETFFSLLGELYSGL